MNRQLYKKFQTLVMCLLSFIMLAAPVYAVIQEEIDDSYEKYSKEKDEEDKPEKLRNFAELVIGYRQEALDSVIGKAGSESRISESNVTGIFSLIDQYKTALNNAQISISGETKLAQLKIKVQNIYWENRIFQVVIPKAYGLKTVSKAEYVLENDILAHMENLDSSEETLEGKGVDTSTLKEKISDLRVLAEDIEYQLQEARTNYESMEPDRNLSISTRQLETARTHLSTAKERLTTAQFRMREIINILDKYSE